MDEKPRQVKDKISFTLKSLCNKMESLRLQCDVLPKLVSFAFLSYLDFLPLYPFYSATFSSYSIRNVAGCTITGVSLSFLLTNPNTVVVLYHGWRREKN